ncbi:MAG: hypothetical protein ABIK26_04675 [Candidatus Omnitrophota bacterium]|nr:hypothetical protein [Candidatus Omnitrophota bacterium]
MSPEFPIPDKYCAIYYKLGDCIMPREGIFARVLKSGEVTVGDDIKVGKNGFFLIFCEIERT